MDIHKMAALLVRVIHRITWCANAGKSGHGQLIGQRSAAILVGISGLDNRKKQLHFFSAICPQDRRENVNRVFYSDTWITDADFQQVGICYSSVQCPKSATVRKKIHPDIGFPYIFDSYVHLNWKKYGSKCNSIRLLLVQSHLYMARVGKWLTKAVNFQ